MTFQQFRDKWTGQQIDFDGIYPNQCMDLMHEYVYECLGITDKTVLAKPWAALVYTQFSWDNLFDKIDNTPTGVPQNGDIVFWDEGLNYDSTVQHGFGHVAIFVDGDAKSFNSFDANFPTGSLPHIQNHTYNHVLGWLRFKPTVSSTTVAVESAKFEELVTKSTEYDKFVSAGYKSAEDVIQKVGDLNETITKLQTQIRQTNLDNASTIDKYKTKLEEDATAIEVGLDAQKQRDGLNREIQSIADALKTGTDLKSILTAIDELKTPIDEQVKPLQQHALSLQNVLDDFIYQRVPKDTWDKIKLWIRNLLKQL